MVSSPRILLRHAGNFAAAKAAVTEAVYWDMFFTYGLLEALPLLGLTGSMSVVTTAWVCSMFAGAAAVAEVRSSAGGDRPPTAAASSSLASPAADSLLPPSSSITLSGGKKSNHFSSYSSFDIIVERYPTPNLVGDKDNFSSSLSSSSISRTGMGIGTGPREYRAQVEPETQPLLHTHDGAK